MAYTLRWLPTAEKRLANIVSYLEYKWTDKEVISFLAKLQRVLMLLENNPHTFRKSEHKKIHEVLVTKHNLLLYRIKGKHVEILTLFDTRQHPQKNLGKRNEYTKRRRIKIS